MLVPRTRKMTTDNALCRFPLHLTISSGNPYAEKLCRLLPLFLPEATVSAAEDAIISLSETPDLAPEAYRLTVRENRITAEAADYGGFRNAMATLSCLAETAEGGYVLHAVTIEDHPAAKFRSFMLDLCRGMKDFDTVCMDLILCAKARLNHVHLHLFDSLGCCMELDCLPASALWDGCYSKAQIRHLVDLADVLGLELIPEFDMPGHSSKLLNAKPDFRCVIPEGMHRSDWSICPSADGIDVFYDAVIQELVSLFPGKYLHLGGDELDFADLPEINQRCHWDDCETCREYRKNRGLADRQEQYYDFILRIYNLVKKTGKTMIIWSDQLDCTRPIPLPRDILLQFWRIAAPGRGPYEGCSLDRQLEAGFQAINAYYPQTYVDLEEYASAESLSRWHWTSIPEVDPSHQDQIIGGEACAWEYGNAAEYSHYDRSLPSAIVLFADQLWNGSPAQYSEAYRQAMTRTILGPVTPAGMDLFTCIGSVLPPRSDQLVYAETISAAPEQVEQILAQLEAHPSPRAKHYLPCLLEAKNFVI